MASYDILIKSGNVLDGSGNPPRFGDVGISQDKISAIGDLGNASAKVTINAYGKYVTPGFIDITNHSDTHLTLFKYPALESMVMQGVTTIIGGNCGASLAPLGSKEAIGAIRKWADPTEINVDWAGVGKFLETVDNLRPGPNFGTFIGYGTLRRGITGDEVRVLTLEEREKIKHMLREGMSQGALGLSLGLSYGHEKISITEELIEISKVLEGGRGVVKIHLRSEGLEILASVNEAVRIGREAGVAIEVSHLKAIGKKAWPSFSKARDLISKAKATGLDIDFDVSPYGTTGSLLYLLTPGWARQGGFADLFKRIEDPAERQKIIETLKQYTLHYDRILITSAKIKSIVGKTMAELASLSGMSPEETLLETIRANEGRVTIIGRTVSLKNTDAAIKDSNSFIASDGAGLSQEALRLGDLVHPRSFGAFAHFWHRYVQDEKALTPQEAVKKISSGPARKIGLTRRGVIEKGAFADIAVFDPRLFRDRATYRNPFRYPAGMEWVIVNGKVAVEQGRYLGVRAGRVLRK